MKANIIEARLDAKKKANKRIERILLDDHVIENLRRMTDYIDKVSWEKCHFTNEFLFVMYVKGTGSYFTAKEITKRIDGKLIKLPKFLKKNSMKENIQWYEEYFESVGFMSKNNDCGREYPMSETRPKTCKLKLIDLTNEFIKREIIRRINNES